MCGVERASQACGARRAGARGGVAPLADVGRRLRLPRRSYVAEFSSSFVNMLLIAVTIHNE